MKSKRSALSLTLFMICVGCVASFHFWGRYLKRFMQSRWENLNALAGEIAFSIYKISISKAYGCALYAVAFKGRALMSAIGRGMIGSLGIESHVFSMSHALAAVASIALSCARR